MKAFRRTACNGLRRLIYGCVAATLLVLAGSIPSAQPARASELAGTSISSGQPPAPPRTSPPSLPPGEVAPRTLFSGVLPDGTDYAVRFSEPVGATIEGIGGVIMIDLVDGTPSAVGVTTFLRQSELTQPTFEDLIHTVPAGDGAVRIEVYPEVAAQVDDVQALLTEAIQPLAPSVGGMPALDLAPPLRWASDDEAPTQMQVQYHRFVVRRGCGPLAVACNVTGAVQVTPSNRVVSGAHSLGPAPVEIHSSVPRPADQPTFLDPGPLQARGGHDVLWTGQEMIVWGGVSRRRPDSALADGAAFDPATNTWRMLAPGPFFMPLATRAVWAGDRMIVVTHDQTVAYDPAVDMWTTIGAGIDPPDSRDHIAWTGSHVVVWSSAGIHLFDPDARVWTRLPDPGVGAGGGGALRPLDGQLYVSGSTGVCPGNERLVASWNGTQWVSAPPVSLDTAVASCDGVSQTATVGGRVIVWDSENHPTMSYDPVTGVWTEVEPIPIGGSKGPSGPVFLGTDFLIPRWGRAALFDTSTHTWTEIVLPGGGDEHEMVWTGQELLMWGAACCDGRDREGFTSIDAWRWPLPN